MEDSQILDLFFARDENAITETNSKYGSRLCVITQTEYDSELAWIAEAKNVGSYNIGFDQNVAKHAHKVLQKNMYTHK